MPMSCMDMSIRRISTVAIELGVEDAEPSSWIPLGTLNKVLSL